MKIGPIPPTAPGALGSVGSSQSMSAEATIVKFWTAQPASSGVAPFNIAMSSAQLNGVYDTFTAIGYNAMRYPPFYDNGGGQGVSGEPVWLQAMENRFYDTVRNTSEWYLQFFTPDYPTAGYKDRRPLYANAWHTDGTVEVIADLGTTSGSFKVFTKDDSTTLPNLLVSKAEVRLYGDDVNVTKGLMSVTHASSTALLQIGSNSGAGTVSTFRMKGGSGKFNFQASVSGVVTNNAWEFTPSTATDGSTYSNPALSITAAGTVMVGQAARAGALATNATTGFLVIPGSAGLQSGTPANAGTGQFAMAYDSTNNKIMVYNGSWRSTGALT